MSTLTFLGTGSAAHLTRQLTSLCITTPKGGLLIDCGDGMGTMRNMIKAGIDLADINDLILTHQHADHISGVPHFLFLKMLKPTSHVSIWGPKEVLTVAKDITYKTHGFVAKRKDQISWIPVLPKDKVVTRNGLSCMFTKVPHGSVPTYAVRVEGELWSVVFSADMSPNDQLVRLARGATYLIHECFGLSRNEQKFHTGHSSARDAGQAASRAGVKTLILTHFPAGEFYVNPKLLKNEASKYFSGHIILAKDLLTFNI